ncbi:protein MEMO1 [Phlebotomus argentipes]|uniref:protein MEMO1 n=1 Tax=Phlebotomus argentipes TaxID=94469 RepID=UPI002892D05E|nr:protein MEMO1 [Phlebotomus argentipes]XP_059611075.1 protein MEMO1 [Phlebotomus argentipes]
MASREATHAGSWYTDSESELNRQLDNWLANAELSYGPARAIIAPHAGYTYCGECAAYAYRQVSPAVVKRVFILGPSHYVRIKGCALTSCTTYKTPFYDLIVDRAVNEELRESQQFQWMDLKTDEDEHSIEMHLPYVAKVMEDFKNQFTIVPILVGSLTPNCEATYGEILAPYLADPQNLFVISSDFCHWGQRFRYTYYEKSCGHIYKSIEKLDKSGMELIESLNPAAFTEYLKKYNNTICGRHPIGVMMQAVHTLQSRGYNMSFKFLKYAQSSQCKSMSDSSVSYASGSLIFE